MVDKCNVQNAPERPAVFCHATNRTVPLSAASHDDAVVANMVLPLDALVDGPLKKKVYSIACFLGAVNPERETVRARQRCAGQGQHVDSGPSFCITFLRDVSSKRVRNVLLYSDT